MSIEQELRALTDAVKALTAVMQHQHARPVDEPAKPVVTETLATDTGILPKSRTLEELRQLCVKVAADDLTFTSKLSLFLKENFDVATIKQLDTDGIAEVYHHIASGHVCELSDKIVTEPDKSVEAAKEPQQPAKPSEPSVTITPTVDEVSQRCLELIRAKIIDKKGLLDVLSKYNGATTVLKVPKDSLAELANELEHIKHKGGTHNA